MVRQKAALPSRNSITLVTGFILLTGLVFLANSSQVYSQSVYNNPFKLSLLQIGWILIGSLTFALAYFSNLKKFRALIYGLFYINLFFLLFLGVLGSFGCETDIAFAPCIKGARRWVYLNPPPMPALPFLGVVGFQPGELIKLSLILYLAFQLDKLIKKGSDPFLFYFLTTITVTSLIVLQPNMSTAILVFCIGTLVYFASGADIKKLLLVIPLLVFLGGLLVLLSPYRRARLAGLLSGSGDEGNYHVRQILISLGSGGVTGVGFGQSKQKYSYLPEVASDSIFAIVGEEFGFFGTTFVIAVFGYLVMRGVKIALEAKELVHKMLSIGIVSWVGLQFLVNVAAMAHLIPLTGVPLPLMSYGGSSLIFCMAGLGVLANIEKLSLQP